MQPKTFVQSTHNKTFKVILGTAALATIVAFSAPAWSHNNTQGGLQNGQSMMGGGIHSQQSNAKGIMPGAATLYSMMKFDDTWADTTKTEMDISADQLDAWNNYVKAAKTIGDNARSRLKSMNPDEVMAMDIAKRNTFIRSMGAKHMAERQALNTAREKLITTLDDKQKAKAGLLIPGRMGGGHGAGGQAMMGAGHGGQGIRKSNINNMMSGMMSNMMQMMQMMQNQMSTMQNPGSMMGGQQQNPGSMMGGQQQNPGSMMGIDRTPSQ